MAAASSAIRRNCSFEHTMLRAMFAARKRVFVDLLKWDVPVLDGSYEIDQFDTPAATYVVLTEADGEHRASARLLETGGPHILADLFPQLCCGPVPRGRDTREITRFCIDPLMHRRSPALRPAGRAVRSSSTECAPHLRLAEADHPRRVC